LLADYRPRLPDRLLDLAIALVRQPRARGLKSPMALPTDSCVRPAMSRAVPLPWIGNTNGPSERWLIVLANSRPDGAWEFSDAGSRLWHATVCNGPDCLCGSACFAIWAGGIRKSGYALGLHRPTLREQSLAGMSPQEAQAAFAEAVRQARAYFAEMEIPTFYVEKMFDTPRENIYVVGDDTSDIAWKQDFMGMMDYAPSIKERVEASCRPSTLADTMEKFTLSAPNPRLDYLDRKLSDGSECEVVLWGSVRRKNVGN